MVARLLRLRVTLMRAAISGPMPLLLRRLVLGLVLVAAAVGSAWLPARLIASEADRSLADGILGGTVLFLTCLLPIFAHRQLLEPRQFAVYPEPPARTATALLLSSVAAWPVVLLLVWLGSIVAFRDSWWGTGAVLPVALLLTIVIAIAGVRVFSALGRLLVRPDRMRLFRAISLLLVLAVLPLLVFVVAESLRQPESSAVVDAARVFGWSPFGAPFAAVQLAAAGEAAAAWVRLAIAGAFALLLIGSWYPLVRFSLERVERPADPTKARQGLGWFEQFPANPAGAIAARTLTYWFRDPRYRTALFAIPLAPIVIVVALWIAGLDPKIIALLPLPVMLLLLGWSVHNDVAADSTAVWIHLASGARGRWDRLGRLAPIVLLGLPLLLIGSSLTVTLLGDWRVLPAVIGMNLGVLLVAMASASVSSAAKPYPTTRPGDSPFVQPAGAGTGAGIAQTVSMLAAVVLSLPPVVFSAQAIAQVELFANAWALLFGAGYGFVVLVLGIWIGGRRFDRRGPELLALTQKFD